MKTLDSTKITFNSHKVHNPECDILEYQLDTDSYLTFGIYVSGPKKGEKFAEYYRGSNYVAGSTKTSYSRHFQFGKIPAKYMNIWIALQDFYLQKYL